MSINELEKINLVKASTYTNSIDNININTSPNTSDGQIHTLNWENPLIQDIVDQDSPAIKIRSWTLIKPESVISDIAVEPFWNLDEAANILTRILSVWILPIIPTAQLKVCSNR